MTSYFPDQRLRRWAGGNLLAGGSPWRLVRVSDPVAALVDRAYRPGGVKPTGLAERRDLERLVERGILHPGPEPRPGPHDVTVVVPAFGRPENLARCLRSLDGLDVIVVDDATAEPSPLRAIARGAGARYLRLDVNRGPAAARNAGLAEVSSSLVAFVDSDCQPEPGWLDHLVPFFDDPRVAVVAPRIVPGGGNLSLVSRFEQVSSALDMGLRPALVRPGAPLGFVPSAALVVRRSVLSEGAFDPQLRLGEDVDLVWRLADAGHHVRYEPSRTVRHEPRVSLGQWVRRRYEYGTSAVDLEARHPGRLAPVRVSPWSLAALTLVALGRPVGAAAALTAATGLLGWQLRRQRVGPGVAARVVSLGLSADAVALGQALRREYWPVGAVAVALASRSRSARLAVGLMVAPSVIEWTRHRHRSGLGPASYTALRMLADAAYGTGVLVSCIRQRDLTPLAPHVRQRDQTGRPIRYRPPHGPRDTASCRTRRSPAA